MGGGGVADIGLKCGRVAVLLVGLAFGGCAGTTNLGGMMGARDTTGLPRQAPDASVILYLASNVNCEFFIDGQSLVTGNRVRVLVTKGDHHVVCKPQGYRAKEEYIRPPYDPNHPISFTFLIEDRLKEGDR